MSFAEPGSLLLLLLVPLAAGAAAGLWWRWHRAARRWVAPYLWHRLLPNHDPRWTAATVALLALAVAALALSLARPQRPAPPMDGTLPRATTPEPSPAREVPGDVILALDTSFSMAADDVRPSRMAVARRTLRELTAALPNHRLALLQWEAEPRVLSPLTADHDLLLVQAEGLEAGSMERPGSALTPALDVATDLLSSNSSATTGAPATNPRRAAARPRAIVVLTDGEDHGGGSGTGASAPDLAEQLAEVLRGSGIRVHGVLVGTREGSRLPLPEGGFKRDADGREVVSRAREEPLRSLVRETGGVLLWAQRADTSLAPLIQSLHSAPSGDEPGAPVREAFQGPLLLAALALFGHLLLGDGPVGRTPPLDLRTRLHRAGALTRTGWSAAHQRLRRGLRWARRRWRARGTAALLCLLVLPWASGQAPAPADGPTGGPQLPGDSARPADQPVRRGLWQSPRRLSRFAVEAYTQGDPALATAAAEAALEKDPENATLLFNAGSARLAWELGSERATNQQESSEAVAAALEHLEKAARTAENPALAADAWYNLGTGLLIGPRNPRDRRRAIQAFEEALRRNPQHQRAQLNLEWALRPPPEPPSPPDPQPEGDSPAPENQPPEPSPDEAPNSGAGSPTEDPRSASDRFRPQPDLSPEAARALLRAVEDLERSGHRQDSEPRRRSTGARDW